MKDTNKRVHGKLRLNDTHRGHYQSEECECT